MCPDMEIRLKFLDKENARTETAKYQTEADPVCDYPPLKKQPLLD
jgi:hypothetical protein